jgi:thymidylate synthase (FAD)
MHNTHHAGQAIKENTANKIHHFLIAMDMTLVLANAKIVSGLEDPAKSLQLIETCGRISHASGDSRNTETADLFVRKLVKLGHESVLEHVSVTVRVECDRAMAQQWTRHRLAAYTMESQRYVRYNELLFVDPEFRDPDDPRKHVTQSACEDRDDVKPLYSNLFALCYHAKNMYRTLLESGIPPEDARSVLPNCTHTVFYTTANLRSWRHLFTERCGPGAQHNIRRVAQELLLDFNKLLPSCFDDLVVKFLPQ